MAKRSLEELRQDDGSYARLREHLLNTQTPLHIKFRAVFTLKALGTDKAVGTLADGFQLDSELLKHEIAYVLGQMGRPSAIPHLLDALKSEKQQIMVRHEAAEALGAIGDASALPTLCAYRDGPGVPKVLAETCLLAVNALSEKQSRSPFGSIDPAPPTQGSVEELAAIMMDPTQSLWHRYRAMFGLRDLGTPEAIQALAQGFSEKQSALFRHEIAFVFGQLNSPVSVPALIKTLSNVDEAPMVRHECAEALGGIATEECREVLERYAKEQSRVVRESCQVALDMWDYENDPGRFQYADLLS